MDTSCAVFMFGSWVLPAWQKWVLLITTVSYYNILWYNVQPSGYVMSCCHVSVVLWLPVFSHPSWCFCSLAFPPVYSRLSDPALIVSTCAPLTSLYLVCFPLSGHIVLSCFFVMFLRSCPAFLSRLSFCLLFCFCELKRFHLLLCLRILICNIVLSTKSLFVTLTGVVLVGSISVSCDWVVSVVSANWLTVYLPQP